MTHSEKIKAAAEAAIGARAKVVNAKAAADAAGGADEALNIALTDAETNATKLEADALTLSQTTPTADDIETKKKKLLRKRNFINKDLAELGVDVEDEDDETGEDEDLDKPVTLRDLQAIEAGKARQTSQQMVETMISDALDRTAVVEALRLIVPSGDPEKDFKAAVAIANIERNSKILEEVARNPVVRNRPTGTGAPANREEVFTPTPQEQAFMRPPFNLSKEAVLKARAK